MSLIFKKHIYVFFEDYGHRATESIRRTPRKVCIYIFYTCNIYILYLQYIHSIRIEYTYTLSRSLVRSLARALSHSLTHSLTHSLARVCSFWVSLARSLARSIDHSRARSLSHSLVRALSGAMSSAGGRALEWCGQGCPSTRQWRRSKMVASTLSLYPKSRSLLTRN